MYPLYYLCARLPVPVMFEMFTYVIVNSQIINGNRRIYIFCDFCPYLFCKFCHSIGGFCYVSVVFGAIRKIPDKSYNQANYRTILSSSVAVKVKYTGNMII